MGQCNHRGPYEGKREAGGSEKELGGRKQRWEGSRGGNDAGSGAKTCGQWEKEKAVEQTPPESPQQACSPANTSCYTSRTPFRLPTFRRKKKPVLF